MPSPYHGTIAGTIVGSTTEESHSEESQSPEFEGFDGEQDAEELGNSELEVKTFIL